MSNTTAGPGRTGASRQRQCSGVTCGATEATPRTYRDGPGGQPHRSSGVDLVGRTWSLAPPAGRAGPPTPPSEREQVADLPHPGVRGRDRRRRSPTPPLGDRAGPEVALEHPRDGHPEAGGPQVVERLVVQAAADPPPPVPGVDVQPQQLGPDRLRRVV